MKFDFELPDNYSALDEEVLNEVLYGEETWPKAFAKIQTLYPTGGHHPKLLSEPEKEGSSVAKDTEEKASGGLHCTKCGASASLSQLGAYHGATQVPMGTPGSKVECIDMAECRERKEKKKDNKDDKSSSFSDKSGWSGQFGGTSYVMKCRHKATAAFTWEGIAFYGGSESKVSEQFFNPKDWIVVSLLGYNKNDQIITVRDSKWAELLKPYAWSPNIIIDWGDMKAPPLKPGFWTALVSLAKKNKKKNILFYCMGGHGRTGTALASVLVECCGMGVIEAVKFVRSNYCKEAVETQSQIDYLRFVAAVADQEEEAVPEQESVPAKADSKKEEVK